MQTFIGNNIKQYIYSAKFKYNIYNFTHILRSIILIKQHFITTHKMHLSQ